MDFLALDLVKRRSALVIVGCEGLVFQFLVLDVDQLPQVENVVDSLDHVPHYLLQVLNLNVPVEHQQRIRKGHIDLGRGARPFILGRSIGVFLGRRDAEIVAWVRLRYLNHNCRFLLHIWLLVKVDVLTLYDAVARSLDLSRIGLELVGNGDLVFRLALGVDGAHHLLGRLVGRHDRLHDEPSFPFLV